MFAAIRARLSYANVVATLALFVALGGSAYAVATIGSNDVKNRSLKGKDLRKNTVTGKEIKERSLGRVRSARDALQAVNAGIADLANNATNASVADLAKNSDAVGGLGAAALEKSSRTSFGRALMSPPDAAGEQALLEWPELGVRLGTAAGNGGCGTDIGLRISHTKASGPTLRVYDGASEITALAPGAQVVGCSNDAGRWEGTAADSSGRTLFFDCRVVDTETRCLGTRSEP